MPGAGGPNSCIGTPDLIRQRLRDYQDAGVDQVVFISQAGNNKHEDICDSLNLFAKTVLPEFKEQHQARERQKMERIAPILERAMSRKREPEVPKTDGPTIIQAGMLP
jgi:alkanesulfonate monooxygenase SsuD/methylene tetrahydromethanopterin reductase-like flavin-dependent oxidoreductase (luciferase family)